MNRELSEMEETSFHGAKRRETRRVDVGGVAVGGGAPVSVQTMANVDPHDAVALAAQVARCAERGADLVRLTVPDAEAARKCREKNLDLVVGNDVTRPGSGFGTTTNRVTLVTPDGAVRRLPLMSKLAVARRIVTFAERIASDG